jgi:hypothetical protein
MPRTSLGPSSSASRWIIASIAAQVVPKPRFPVRANVDAAVESVGIVPGPRAVLWRDAGA